jgi:nicotinamidase-related amidase
MKDTFALLLIDIQNEVLCFDGSDKMEKRHQIFLDKIVELQSWSREENIINIHVQHDGGQGHRLKEGTSGWEINKKITVLDEDARFYKKHCSSFSETGLEEFLKEHGIKNLVIAGCMTNFCIDTTCRAAIEHGYNVFLAEDGHMTSSLNGFSYDQIIEYHNEILTGLTAEKASLSVLPVSNIINNIGG